MIVTSTDIKGLPKHATGKVRDVYDLGDSLLMIASDRLSAFDVVLPTGIPDKGKVLTQLSLFWFDLTKDIIDNHLITADINLIIEAIEDAGVEDPEQYREMLDGRSMLVVKANVYPIESVVRGYLFGSAWKEYLGIRNIQANEPYDIYGTKLPNGMVEAQKLPQSMLTPSTKESSGHDINITPQRMRQLIGDEAGYGIEVASLGLYECASEYAAERGVIICDTKFEFGELDGKLILVDEVLTPDSSRFWDRRLYKPGQGQSSFDKQFVRDYLLTLDWDQTYPGPELPEEIVRQTSAKYREAYRFITGVEL